MTVGADSQASIYKNQQQLRNQVAKTAGVDANKVRGAGGGARRGDGPRTACDVQRFNSGPD